MNCCLCIAVPLGVTSHTRASPIIAATVLSMAVVFFMKIVIAPDSFKENLTAKEVGHAIEKGIKRVVPSAKCVVVPMADGGEGTVFTVWVGSGCS